MASNIEVANPLKTSDWIRTRDQRSARLTAPDQLVFAYLSVLLIAVAAGSGPRRPLALGMTAGILVTYVLLQKTARETGREVIHRLALVFGVLASFLELQYVLPTATERVVDGTLYDFDRMVFGIEPAVAWDRFVTPATTEWFSFFYFNYYTVILVFLVPFVFVVRPGRLAEEFSFGFLFVFCVGQTLYILVPAYGPYAFLHFQHPLEGPVWWNLVTKAVASGEGGVRKDVFPSLHTAAPTFLTLLSFRWRRLRVFRFTWPLMALVASQIIFATMFLRWHYLVDIVAGVALAGIALFAATLTAPPRTSTDPA